MGLKWQEYWCAVTANVLGHAQFLNLVLVFQDDSLHLMHVCFAQGAGTDANVFLTLFGEHNGRITKSKPTKLENRCG